MGTAFSATRQEWWKVVRSEANSLIFTFVLILILIVIIILVLVLFLVLVLVSVLPLRE